MLDIDKRIRKELDLLLENLAKLDKLTSDAKQELNQQRERDRIDLMNQANHMDNTTTKGR